MYKILNVFGFHWFDIFEYRLIILFLGELTPLFVPVGEDSIPLSGSSAASVLVKLQAVVEIEI